MERLIYQSWDQMETKHPVSTDHTHSVTYILPKVLFITIYILEIVSSSPLLSRPRNT